MARVQYFVAITIGITHALIAGVLWSKYVLISPIDDLLVDTLLVRELVAAFYAAAYATDLLVYVALASPFAFILTRLKPYNNWNFLWIALASSTIAMLSTFLFVDNSILTVVGGIWSFYVGLIVFVGSLPLTFLVVVYLMPYRNAT